DSGGPLVERGKSAKSDRVVGIISQGNVCCKTPPPDTYRTICTHLGHKNISTWISEKLKGEGSTTGCAAFPWLFRVADDDGTFKCLGVLVHKRLVLVRADCGDPHDDLIVVYDDPKQQCAQQ
ncbi:unnamed protein product, partial [Ostreobium quekettii]